MYDALNRIRAFNPLFWGFLWNSSFVYDVKNTYESLSILFFEVFFETWSDAPLTYLTLQYFQSSFLRFSLKRARYPQLNIIIKTLSILFFEVFFETGEEFGWLPLPFITFNPLFWGFLWNYFGFVIFGVEYKSFQSSFLRFSLKHSWLLIREQCMMTNFQSSFLRFSLKPWYVCTRIYYSDYNFQSSFLRFSLKLEMRLNDCHPAVATFNPLFWGFLWNCCHLHQYSYPKA